MTAETDAEWVRRQQDDDDDGWSTSDHPPDDDEPDTGPVDLDVEHIDDDTEDGRPDEPGPDEPGGTWSAKTKLFGLAAAGVAAVLVGSALFYGRVLEQDRKPVSDVSEPVAVAPSASSAAANRQADVPLRYTAEVEGCTAGSTSAQTMDGATPNSAFVCGRGEVGDGQKITIMLPKTYVVTAIVITPGWVGKDASGTEQWAQHRVVSTVQYTFNDSEHTLITQETQNVHGQASIAVHSVMASQVVMLIRQTARPPAQPAPTAAPSGGLGSILGDSAPTVAPPPQVGPLFGESAPDSDPVDATFAISSFKVMGHEAI